MKTKRNQNAPKSPAARPTNVPQEPPRTFLAWVPLLKNAMPRIRSIFEGQDAGPEWAKRARLMVLDALVPLRRKPAGSEAYNVGFLCGYEEAAVEVIAKGTREAYGRRLLKLYNTLRGELYRKVQFGFTPEMAADFFAGRRDGGALLRGVPQRANNLAQRTKIYCAIADRWKEVMPGKLNSTAQLHQWLLSQKVILRGTDSVETRKVCAKIGLRYKRPGKPGKS